MGFSYFKKSYSLIELQAANIVSPQLETLLPVALLMAKMIVEKRSFDFFRTTLTYKFIHLFRYRLCFCFVPLSGGNLDDTT